MEQYNTNQFAEAAKSFKAAFALEAEPRILINLGRSYYRLQRHKAALQAYQECLNLPGATGDLELQNKLSQYIAEASQADKAKEPGSLPLVPTVQAADDGSPRKAPGASGEIRPSRRWVRWAVVGSLLGAAAVGTAVGLSVNSSSPMPMPPATVAGLPAGTPVFRPMF